MKIRDLISTKLFEGPYDMEDDYRPVIHLPSFPSQENLQRLSDFLGELHRNNRVYSFWLFHNLAVAKITTSALDDIGQTREQVVSEIRFNNRAIIPNLSKKLQIEMVYTDPKFQADALAASMYITLCRYGFNIISDYTQYNGGKAIWKKLAKESDSRKIAVRVWSDNIDDWVKDENGTPIKYTGDNLADKQIWDSVFGTEEKTRLLVLSAK